VELTKDERAQWIKDVDKIETMGRSDPPGHQKPECSFDKSSWIIGEYIVANGKELVKTILSANFIMASQSFPEANSFPEQRQ